MENSYSLYELADENFLVIPELQRGLVWNAARIESLWDSILRGIPIGAISIRNGEVFDGQQRRHAIQVGLNFDPSKKDKEILWIDLVAGDEVENRAYSFRVTTPAHPWGYKVSKDDRTNSYLSYSERRSSIEWMLEHGFTWERSGDVAERPYPFEMIPWDSELPVPFAVLDSFVRELGDCGSLGDFIDYVKGRYSEQNWHRYFEKNVSASKVDESYWRRLLGDVARLKSYRVLVVDASMVKDADVGLYFKRMNKNGEEPRPAEIQYSLLKSKLGVLKSLDDYADGFSSPATLAQLAMVYYKSEKNGKLIMSVSDNDISNFAREDAFIAFVTSKLPGLIKGADSILKIGKRDGLLPWHRTRICSLCWPLYMYLMRESKNPESDINYAGLALMVRVFANNLEAIVKELWESESVRSGLRVCIEKEFLARPMYVEELGFLGEPSIVEGAAWHRRLLARMKEVGSRIGYFSSGFDSKSASIDLLLYGCREFMSLVFGKYDAADQRWMEQSIPWDYDHILPKSWVHTNVLTGNEYTEVCKEFLWSIGNSAPIPFSVNRSKNAGAPGADYPFVSAKTGGNYARELRMDLGAIAKYEYHWKYFDDNGNVENIQNFVKTTAQRFLALYRDAFESLGWGQLLQMDLENDYRYKLLSRAAERVKGDLYVCLGKMRIRLSRDPSPANLLLRASTKYQLCVPYKSVVVCFETDDKSCREGWVGVCRRNDESRVDDGHRQEVVSCLGEGLAWDEDWYGWEDVAEGSEDRIVALINEWVGRLVGLAEWK